MILRYRSHVVRPAASDDLPELLRLRAVMFSDLAATGWDAPPPDSGWQDAFSDSAADLLTRPDACVLVVPTGYRALAACAMGIVDTRLPSPHSPGGHIGHVFGVVTDPAHRRHGHARRLLRALLDWFTGQGLVRIDLNASPDAQALYRSLGFTDHPDPALCRIRRGSLRTDPSEDHTGGQLRRIQ